MTESVTEETSRANRSSTLYHAFLISWIQCIIVIKCSVTMATQSSDGAEATGIFNTSTDHKSQDVKTLETFTLVFPVPCPPVDSLQLVCDHSLGTPEHTCNDRAFVIDKCLRQYPGLYNNSFWNQCLDVNNQCLTVFKNILRSSGVIIDDDELEHITQGTTVTILSTQTEFISISSNVTLKPVTSSSSTATSAQPDTSNFTTSGMESSEGDGDFPPISYVYPIIGAFIIAFEVAVLCLFSCYKKKRRSQNAADSLVQQEEVIEPETASPTKAALNANSVYDEDRVFSEDKKIYKSYINLKYIDDTSVESTPEKTILRT